MVCAATVRCPGGTASSLLNSAEDRATSKPPSHVWIKVGLAPPPACVTTLRTDPRLQPRVCELTATAALSPSLTCKWDLAPLQSPGLSEQKVMSNKEGKKRESGPSTWRKDSQGAARLPSLCAAAQARLGGSRTHPFRLALNVLSHSQSQ